MKATARIWHVDAFTSTPLEGNPAAVVEEAGIDGATMQRIALNQKLSETVFLLPPESPENHARLRIFTPAKELPFAGHPTLSAAHILTSEGIVSPADGDQLRLETGAGVIPLDIDAATRTYTMTQRPPEFRDAPVGDDEAAAWLGLEADDIVRNVSVSTGLWWHIVQIRSFEAMLRVRPNFTLLGQNEVSLFCLGSGSDADIRVRTFAPAAGVPEDPVTGSSNGCIAALIARDKIIPARDGEVRYIAEQGIEMGQPGRVFARVTGLPDAPSVQIGGQAVTVLRGELLLA